MNNIIYRKGAKNAKQSQPFLGYPMNNIIYRKDAKYAKQSQPFWDNRHYNYLQQRR